MHTDTPTCTCTHACTHTPLLHQGTPADGVSVPWRREGKLPNVSALQTRKHPRFSHNHMWVNKNRPEAIKSQPSRGHYKACPCGLEKLLEYQKGGPRTPHKAPNLTSPCLELVAGGVRIPVNAQPAGISAPRSASASSLKWTCGPSPCSPLCAPNCWQRTCARGSSHPPAPLAPADTAQDPWRPCTLHLRGVGRAGLL